MPATYTRAAIRTRASRILQRGADTVEIDVCPLQPDRAAGDTQCFRQMGRPDANLPRGQHSRESEPLGAISGPARRTSLIPSVPVSSGNLVAQRPGDGQRGSPRVELVERQHRGTRGRKDDGLRGQRQRGVEALDARSADRAGEATQRELAACLVTQAAAVVAIGSGTAACRSVPCRVVTS